MPNFASFPSYWGYTSCALQVGELSIRFRISLPQPSILGHDQAGISETVEFVLKKYPPETQVSQSGRVRIHYVRLQMQAGIIKPPLRN